MDLRLEEPELKIAYFPDTDTLVLNAEGGSPLYGETVGRNLVAFTDEAEDVVGVTLEHAAQLLRPYLCPECPPHERPRSRRRGHRSL